MGNPQVPWERVLTWIEQPDRSSFDQLTYFVVNVGLSEEDEHRGILWQKLSSAYDMRMNNPGLYQKLLATPTLYEKNINADIHRSFPNDEIQQRINTPEKLRCLYNVLHAYSVFDKNVSYCQGMNYIVAVLLIYMEEEAAFWTLVRMMFFYGIAWLYRDDVATLADYIQMFDYLAKQRYPEITAYLEEQMLVANSYITEWFTTLFVYRLSLHTVARVWDYFFLVGQEALFQVGLAVISTSGDLIGVPVENIIPRMRQKLFNFTAADLLPRAQSIAIPPRFKRMLVDDRITTKEKRRKSRREGGTCIVS